MCSSAQFLPPTDSVFFFLSAALLPQIGKASLQPDASNFSCKGSHQEQQSLRAGSLFAPEADALPGMCRLIAAGVLRVGTAKGGGV